MINNRIYYDGKEDEVNQIIEDEIFRNIYLKQSDVVALAMKHKNLAAKFQIHSTSYHEYPIIIGFESNTGFKNYIKDIKNIIYYYKKVKKNVKVYIFDLIKMLNEFDDDKLYIFKDFITDLLEGDIELIISTPLSEREIWDYVELNKYFFEEILKLDDIKEIHFLSAEKFSKKM